MRIFLLNSVLFLSCLHYCLSVEVAHDDFEEETSRSANTDLDVIKENSRASCTERKHDCTKDRHSCCRGKIFKDICECVQIKNAEKCSCQQPWYYKIIEELVGPMPALPKGSTKDCVPKHYDCTSGEKKCCKGALNIRYACQCYDVEDDSGKTSKTCSCVSKTEAKLLENAIRVAKKVIEKSILG